MAVRVRDFLAVAIAGGLRNPAQAARRYFRIAPQSVSRSLSQLVREGVLEPQGKTRARQYTLRLIDAGLWSAEVTKSLAEHELWDAWLAPRVGDVPDNVRAICHYSFTEMVNNVVDHSESAKVTVTFERSPLTIRIMVTDQGIGVFNKLQRDLGFENKREAVFELTKGKLTTDPTKHTGEGIFFTSRMMDVFMLVSEDLCLGRHWAQADVLLESVSEPVPGTSVIMTIGSASERDMKEVFDHYAASQEDYAFAKTRVLVKLARSAGERLVSRSQARRILARYDKFKELTLDFDGIDMIGPAFADEIFRVFRAENPQFTIAWVNASAVVERMIRKALAGEAEPAQRDLPLK